ncbi:MAG: ABC transporter substrate-binding protein [Desulfobacteraceae bacterium]|nr:ABC transporter substrate-binding protein [Desulfobacteraceae bacterium]
MVKKILIGLVLFIFCTGFNCFAADTDKYPMTPKLNKGKKWNVAYHEGGEYIEYKMTLIATIKGLMKIGWIEPAKIPDLPGEDTKSLWTWMSKNLKSKYLRFNNNAHYSAGWKEETRKKIVSSIIKRLNWKQKDIDLIIAMGTSAAEDLANNKHKTPTIALAVSDALSSGIIKSYEDSGLDHLHARVDPLRYERQIKIFHDIIGFQKLGIMYEDTVRGKSYASVDKVEKIAKEKGFEIVRCIIPTGIEDKKLAEKSVKRCFTELCNKADAIYVTLHTGVNANSLPSLVEIANETDTPTFSQAGSEEVKYGLLMSISQAEFKYVGLYHAETIAKIFNGAKPRQLGQFFEEPSQIAINLKTAENIGYDPPIDILSAADEIFEDYPEK